LLKPYKQVTYSIHPSGLKGKQIKPLIWDF